MNVTGKSIEAVARETARRGCTWFVAPFWTNGPITHTADPRIAYCRVKARANHAACAKGGTIYRVRKGANSNDVGWSVDPI